MHTMKRLEIPDALKSDGGSPQETKVDTKYTDSDEAMLLEKCKRGDMAAWDSLVRRYEKSVYRFAYTLCKDRDDAADIAGHVFTRVYQNIHTFRHEASFSSWMFRIVRNTYLDLCVRPAWRSNVTVETNLAGDSCDGVPRLHDIADPSPSPETICIRAEVAALLANAVKHLPVYQREVLRMYHSDGKSYEEIAQATGLSIGTVKSRINRARNMLRERLMPFKDTLVLN